MLVKEVMNSDVKTIEPGETVLEAAIKMNEFKIGCLVVISNDRLAGILTDRDILERVVAKDKKASSVLVRNAMTTDLVLIEDDKEITEAAEIMEKSQIKKLPVVSGNSLVGILTALDLASAQPKLIEKISKLMIFPKTRKNVAG
jgi:CBS domain-containing protein